MQNHETEPAVFGRLLDEAVSNDLFAWARNADLTPVDDALAAVAQIFADADTAHREELRALVSVRHDEMLETFASRVARRREHPNVQENLWRALVAVVLTRFRSREAERAFREVLDAIDRVSLNRVDLIARAVVLAGDERTREMLRRAIANR